MSIERETFPALVEDGTSSPSGSDAYWLDTGTPDAYLRAHRDLLLGRRPVLAPGAVAVLDPDLGPGVWRIGEVDVPAQLGRPVAARAGGHGGAERAVEESVIGAGAVVEDGASVTGSVLLPGARVASKATVEGSVIGPGAIVGQRCVIHGLSVIGAGAVTASGTVIDGERIVGGSLIVRTLVTGGAGFIGSTLVDRLLAEGHTVDVVDDLSTGSLANLADARASAGHQLTVHQMDVRSPEVVELLARRRPEVVFHLAAQADVRVSVADPVFDADVNVIGTLRVLEGARSADAGRVVFAASGGTLYGEPDPSELPLKESLPHRPLSPYGVSKKAAIDYLVAYRELHSLEFAALALANVYGPRQDPHGEAGVVAIFAERLLAGRAGDHLRGRRADP